MVILFLLICTSVHNLTGGGQTDLLSSSSVYLLPNSRTGKKAFAKMNRQCQHCFKTFFCASNKKRHEKICLGLKAKKRLHCYICGKGFVSAQKRTKHEKNCVNVRAHVLQDLKKFPCEKCHHTFASKQMWKQHSCKDKTISVSIV